MILQGDAQELDAPDSVLVERLIEISNEKYGFAPKLKDLESGVFVFRARVAFAGKQFPKDVTRWELD